MSRKKVLIILSMGIMHFAFTQNKQVLFGFNDIPQSTLINPSTRLGNDWFMGVPLLSHIHFNFGSSNATAFDLFADDGRDFNTKLQSVVFQLDNRDFFTATQQLDVFTGGFSFGNGIEKDKYLTFGMYIETDVIAYHPKDYAVLAFEGNANSIGKVFDLGDLNVSGEMVSVFHIGLAKKVNKKLTIGARGKIYSSIFNINSTKNSGTFVTAEGEDNLLRHTFNLNLRANTSGFVNLVDDENTDISNDIKTLRRRLLLGGNLGLGLDFGVTYQPTDQMTLEASIQDVGFIRHTKDVETYAVNGSYIFDGFNPLFPEVANGQTAEEYWNEVADEFEDLFEVDTSATKYTTWRPVKFNAALRYAFGKKTSKDCDCLSDDVGYLNAVGAQLYAMHRPKAPQLALTAFYYRRLFEGLRAKVTYTIDPFSFYNVGLGISTQLGAVNLYMIADNLLDYQNLAKARSVSLQFGLNLVFGRGQKP